MTDRFSVPLTAYHDDAQIRFSFAHLRELQAGGSFADLVTALDEHRAEMIEKALELGLNYGEASECLETVPTGDIVSVLLDALFLRVYGRTVAEHFEFVRVQNIRAMQALEVGISNPMLTPEEALAHGRETSDQ